MPNRVYHADCTGTGSNAQYFGRRHNVCGVAPLLWHQKCNLERRAVRKGLEGLGSQDPAPDSGLRRPKVGTE
jgi:hypothetical protein